MHSVDRGRYRWVTFPTIDDTTDANANISANHAYRIAFDPKVGFKIFRSKMVEPRPTTIGMTHSRTRTKTARTGRGCQVFGSTNPFASRAVLFTERTSAKRGYRLITETRIAGEMNRISYSDSVTGTCTYERLSMRRFLNFDLM